MSKRVITLRQALYGPKEEKGQATREQLILAYKYNIPIDQADTINIAKAKAYARNPQVKLEKFLDDLDEKRLKSQAKRSFGVPREFLRGVSGD